MSSNSNVDLRISIPIEVDAALAQVTRATGEAKRSLVRRATIDMLVATGVLDPDFQVAPTATAGALASERRRRRAEAAA